MTSTSTTDHWKFSSAKEAEAYLSAPVYKYASASIPVTEQVLKDAYQSPIRDQIIQESPFLDLLKKQTEKATKAMAADLERELFYGTRRTFKNETLRQCIADAYDEHMPKEAEVSAVDEVMKEREEARARELFEKVDEIFTNAGYEVGHLTSWTVVFEVGGKEYHYAAVLAGDGCWYVTGRDTTGRKTEAFKGYLVELAMRAHTFELEGEAL